MNSLKQAPRVNIVSNLLRKKGKLFQAQGHWNLSMGVWGGAEAYKIISYLQRLFLLMLTLELEKVAPISKLSSTLRHKTDEAGYQQLAQGVELITQFTTGSFQNSTINLDTCILHNLYFYIASIFKHRLKWGFKHHFVLCVALYTPLGAKDRTDAEMTRVKIRTLGQK